MTSPAQLRSSLAPYDKFPLQDLLRRAIDRGPGKVAVIDGDGTYSYSQLGEYSDRLASALVGLGVNPGDRVAILAPNCVEFVIAFYGIVKAGAIVTTVNSGYREREIAHQLNDSGAETLIVHLALKPMSDAARSETPALVREIVIEPDSSDPDSFWGLLENASPVPPSIPVDPVNDVAVLPYSSGTTGLSKGVMLTHFNLVANVQQFLDRKDEADCHRAR